MAKSQKQGESTSVNIGVLDDGTGTVIFQTNHLVKEIRFTPEQAIALGVGLIQWGTRGESLQRVGAAGQAKGPRRLQ